MFFKKIQNAFVQKIAAELQCPSKSAAGYLVATYFGFEKNLLESRALECLNLEPEHNVLEIGCGFGNGLLSAFQYVENGTGRVCGVDRSKFMVERAKRLCSKEVDDGKIDIHWSFVEHLPYPSEAFDKIFHCNEYYYWAYRLDIVREVLRVMKPGAQMVCALKLDRLKRLESAGCLASGSFDPLDFMDTLEAAGFDRVGIQYYDYDEVISAEKPPAVIENTGQEISEEELLEEEYAFTKHFVNQNRIARMKRINSTLPPDKALKEEDNV